MQKFDMTVRIIGRHPHPDGPPDNGFGIGQFDFQLTSTHVPRLGETVTMGQAQVPCTVTAVVHQPDGLVLELCLPPHITSGQAALDIALSDQRIQIRP